MERAYGTHQDRLIKKVGGKGSIATKPPTSIWKKNMCRRTTDGLRFQQLSRRTITVASRLLRNSVRSSLETERGIGNDRVIRHGGGNLQLKPGFTTLWAHPKRGFGLRVGGRNHGGVLPRRSDRSYGAEEAAPESLCPASPARQARGGAES